MNCLDFRREILVNPRAASDETQRHARDCAACADFQARATALDAEIAELLDVPVPEGLEERILEATSSGRRDSRRRFLAMAASLAGVAVVGTGVFVVTRDDPMALAGIDFVVEEEANAILTAKAANPAELVRAVQTLGLDLPSQLGEVRYIGTCPFQGTIAHHVIVTTPQGKATLLLLPDKPLERRGAASARGLRSIIKPAGRGCAAVIAESSRGLERIEQMVWTS
jgi:phosphatidylethanolamine-binding protein (PEBP) family uncharacterized protein